MSEPAHPLALPLLSRQISVVAQKPDHDSSLGRRQPLELGQLLRHPVGVDVLAPQNLGPGGGARDIHPGYFPDGAAGFGVGVEARFGQGRARPAATVPPFVFHVKHPLRDQSQTAARLHQPLARRVHAEEQSVFRPRSEHAVRLAMVAPAEVIHQNPEIGVLAPRHERRLAAQARERH